MAKASDQYKILSTYTDGETLYHEVGDHESAIDVFDSWRSQSEPGEKVELIKNDVVIETFVDETVERDFSKLKFN